MILDQTAAEHRATLPFGRLPTSEDELTTVLEAIETISSPELQRRASAAVLLARGAGATEADLRYVRGSDVVAVPHAGIWVAFRRPGFERRVPVAWGFARDLQRLAIKGRRQCLVGPRDRKPICSSVDVAETVGELQARTEALSPGALVTVERLRRGWLLERLRDPLSVREFLHLTGERSWTVVRELMPFCPASPSVPAILARTTGAVSDREVLDLAAWGLG